MCRQQQFRQSSHFERALLRQAGNWSLHEVLLSREWNKETHLSEILVARRSLAGQIAAGVFLVDLCCLGVKSAFAHLFHSLSEYEQTLRHSFMSISPKMRADLNLVAKIIREGIAYALQFGFNPDPDYHDAMLVLGEANPNACTVPIPLGGKDGKPFYIARPYDDVPRIMDKLIRAVGKDGFHYMVPVELEEDE